MTTKTEKPLMTSSIRPCVDCGSSNGWHRSMFHAYLCSACRTKRIISMKSDVARFSDQVENWMIFWYKWSSQDKEAEDFADFQELKKIIAAMRRKGQ